MNLATKEIYGRAYQKAIATAFGTVFAGSNKYNSLTKAPNGNLYSFPNAGATQILEYNPLTGVISYYGTLSGIWGYSCLAPNGNIYGFSSSGTSIVEFNPVTKAIAYYGSFTAGKAGACFLGEDGDIYVVPSNGTQIMQFNPVTKAITYFGSLGSGLNRWFSVTMGFDGKGYAFPFGASYILEINTVAKTTTNHGSISGSNRYSGCQLLTDHDICAFPHSTTQVMSFNTTTKVISYYGSFMAGSSISLKQTMGKNGKMYGSPLSYNKALEFDPITKVIKELETYNSASLSKFSGITLADNGDLISVPNTETSLLKITGTVSPNIVGSDYLIPTTLSDLPTSNYNKYYNK